MNAAIAYFVEHFHKRLLRLKIKELGLHDSLLS